jgi:hypothetical protein
MGAVRYVGGKSLFWSRMSFRLSYEFKVKDYDGFGDNWHINLADLAPHDQGGTDSVRYRKEGLKQLPDGNFIEATTS